jgi:hypothetical protein
MSSFSQFKVYVNPFTYTEPVLIFGFFPKSSPFSLASSGRTSLVRKCSTQYFCAHQSIFFDFD